ncbi:hypothetical protein [Candidatus Uabimicrobium sp. HlEnr_7]|uniref:hypothetical protein n=1 Tax=Candidatus Uabimicrobium helgolandensis TaxID=3095367 RepID=UPI003558D6C6
MKKIIKDDIEDGILDLSYQIVTEENFRQLKQFGEEIYTLYLMDSDIEHLCYRYFCELQNLELLFLRGTDIKDDDLKYFADMELFELGLDRTKITNLGLQYLSSVTIWERLDLEYTNIDDSGLVHLRNHTELEHLNLCCPGVTSEGVAELQKFLPQCKIEHLNNSLTFLKDRVSSRLESVEIKVNTNELKADLKKCKEIYEYLQSKKVDYEKIQQAREKLYTAQRTLYKALGEEYAIMVDDFPLKWSSGTPGPILLTHAWKTFLIFYVGEENEFGKNYIELDGEGHKEKMALVEFDRCLIAKLGAPNDEVFCDHPLEGRGADSFDTVQIVMNSSWLASIEKINSGHSCYNPFHWKYYIHYIFWFKEDIFECITMDYKVTPYLSSRRALLQKVAASL